MKHLNWKICIVLLPLCTMFTLRLHAQINRDQIIGSYIYNFANKVNRSGKNLQIFTIVLLSSDKGLIQKLKKVASQKKVNEKPIELQVSNKPSPSITDAQLVFIARDKLQYYMTVFDMVEGKEILLVRRVQQQKLCHAQPVRYARRFYKI